MIKKQIKILIAGALVVIPVAFTVWLVVTLAEWLTTMGEKVLVGTGIISEIPPEYGSCMGWAGVLLLVVAVYLVGLMTRFLLFKKILDMVDRLLSRLPGIKIIYESTRDLLELFGGDAGKAGYPVLYTAPGGNIRMLGIVTNENPAGRPPGDDSVLVYLPMGYMIGGPIVYASPASVEKLDMSVETAMRLAATAFIAKEEISGN